MKIPVAFLDANVLYSRTLCDWIFMLRREQPGLFLVCSSADAVEEAMYRLRRRLPNAAGGLMEHKRELLRANLDELVTDFPGAPEFAGDDADDAHIHAAATHINARYLVTNDDGFSRLASDDAEYEARTADAFLCLVAENAPFATQAVIV